MSNPAVPWTMTVVAVGFFVGVLSERLPGLAGATVMPGDRLPITTAGVTIVNESGKARASLQLWDGDHPALILSDDRCGKRASLALSERGRPALVMFGDDCKRRVALEVHSEDVASLVLRDRDDRPRARLQLLNDGSPLLEMFDKQGRRIQTVPDKGR